MRAKGKRRGTPRTSARNKDKVSCPECGLKFKRTPTFCPNCGQRLDVGGLQLSEIFGELIGTLVNLDLPILKTTKDLLKGPGPVATAWIAGKRRTYINPIKFITIVGVVVALLYQPIQQYVMSAQTGGAIYESGLARYSTRYFALFCIGLLIPIALTTRVMGFFFGLDKPWLDWYILLLYCYGLGVALQLILTCFSIFLPANQGFAVSLIKSMLPVLIFVWGAFQFHGTQRRWQSLSTAILAHVVFFGVILLLWA